ncbi:DUF3006 domain-containing protein [Paenisporosarcina cavernae]|uniref:DUF3006 domain-containing protein n=1 Tax=Paenisporosarcina cavernae TaxID=2320858 RepID=A0A385YQS4_9BACL|nr:DUF3006 domain-containing protein [Paenisporosarcina cavernae]AYC28740.1 DUF3006 domain-containing protein [Paenisporosarcina cavernae]
MNSNKYTLDRFEDGKAVFLSKEDESKQVLLDDKIVSDLSEGDIVKLHVDPEGKWAVQCKLEDETAERKKEVNDLIEKLKNK